MKRKLLLSILLVVTAILLAQETKVDTIRAEKVEKVERVIKSHAKIKARKLLKIKKRNRVKLTLKSTDSITATVYNAVVEQCNSDPGHTAFMFKLDLENPYKHKIIAVSRDLLIKYPKGTKVRVKGTTYDGIYTVMDKMNKRYTNRIDILINTDMEIGRWDNATITKIS